MNNDDLGAHFWASHWWLIFIAIWFVFGLAGMWLRHLRHRDMMKMIQGYAAQGKEPPEALVAALTRPSNWRGDAMSPYGYRFGLYRTMRRTMLLLSLAAAFVLLWFLQQNNLMVLDNDPDTTHGFLTAAIILGTLGFGSLLLWIFHPERRDRLNKP